MDTRPRKKENISDKETLNTRGAIEVVLHTFRSYLNGKGKRKDFELLTCQEFDERVERSFLEVGAAKGELNKVIIIIK